MDIGKLVFGLHILGLAMALLIPSGVVRVLILMPMCRLAAQNPRAKAPELKSQCWPRPLADLRHVLRRHGHTDGRRAQSMVILGVLESRRYHNLLERMGLLSLSHHRPLARWPCSTVSSACYFAPSRELDLSAHSAIADIPAYMDPAPKKKVLGILIAGVLLWTTDVIHGIHTGLYRPYPRPSLLSTRLGTPCPLTPSKKSIFPLLIFISAVFAIGHALEQSGLNRALASVFIHHLQTVETPIAQLALIAYLAVPFDFLMDTDCGRWRNSPPSCSTSVLNSACRPFPSPSAWPLARAWVFIPYQGAPFIVAYSFRYARMGQFVLVMSLISLVTLIALLPLTLLYWRMIGFI